MKRIFSFMGIVVLFALTGGSAYALDCSVGVKIADDCKAIAGGLEGCCSADGRYNVWCEQNKDKTQSALCLVDCSTHDRPGYNKCGWNPHFGYYDCVDDGADPSGKHPLACPSDCTPNCNGKECGYDGCYGLCGTCPKGEYCDAGKCQACSCDGRECGSDECGNPCGTCADGKVCNKDGKCVANDNPGMCSPNDDATKVCGANDTACKTIQDCTCQVDKYCCNKSGNAWDDVCVQEARENCNLECKCVPDCKNKECGDDGCGGTCGKCADGQFCQKQKDSQGHATGMKCVQCTGCNDKECGYDECKTACGGCTGGKFCDTDAHKCIDQPAYCVEKNGPNCGQNSGDCDPKLLDCVCNKGVTFFTAPDPYCCGKDKDGNALPNWKWDLFCVVEYQYCGLSTYHDSFQVCPCEPNCNGKECGDDGCGGTCGKCADGQTCNDKGKCVSTVAGCGDGKCDSDSGEDCKTCPDDCACQNGQVCDAMGECVDCTAEGKTFPSDLGACCAGLKAISTAKPDSDGNCPSDQPVGASLCTNCGNGTCEADKGENKCNCPDDCKAANPNCGDGTCDANAGEDCNSCPDDCACQNGQVCTAEGKCVDCTTEGNTFAVGMGKCCTGLKAISTAKPDSDGNCPSDQPVGASLCTNCGNGTCEADKGENKCNCPDDCKAANPNCGDGTCDANAGENCGTCPADCKCDSGQVCHNNACCTPKTCTDLGIECGNADDSCGGTLDCGQCDSGKTCVNGKCQASTACGDGTCDANAGENCGTCPADCACQDGKVCYSNTCCTPKTCADLGFECGSASDSCGGTLDCGQCPAGQTCQSGKCASLPTADNGSVDNGNGVPPQFDATGGADAGQSNGGGGGGGCSMDGGRSNSSAFAFLLMLLLGGLMAFRRRFN